MGTCAGRIAERERQGQTCWPPKNGLSWVKIAEKLGVGEGTVRRAAMASAKTLSSAMPAND